MEKNVSEGMANGFNETSTVGFVNELENKIDKDNTNMVEKDNHKAFSWLGVNTPYAALKPIF